jgi:signal transduction histidine kinase
MTPSPDNLISSMIRERNRVLAQRVRIALQWCLITIPVFALGEFLARDDLLPLTYDFFTLGQLSFLALLLLLLGRPPRTERAMPIAIIFGLELALATVTAGIARQDPNATPVLLLILTMGTAAFFPWGALPQAAVAFVSSLSLYANVPTAGNSSKFFSDPTIWALGIGFAISPLIAHWLENNRRALVRENLVRLAAEEALRKAQQELESRVLDRTRSLAESNRLLMVENEQRLRVERELGAAMHSAREANRAKSQFLANMSHELRTPLNVVMGASEMFLDDLTPEQHRHAGKMVRKWGKVLVRLIGDLLDVSKVEAQQLKLETRNFVLLDLISEVVHIFTPSIRSRGVLLRYEVDPELPAVLHGDSHRIMQILTNFLSNAEKFTDDGAIDLRVRCLAKTADKAVVRFSVTDTGIGITDESQQDLFEPFVQIQPGRLQQTRGSGLGLTICRQVALTMNGQVGVESKIGVGSTFWFNVPLELEQGDPESLRSERSVEDQPLRSAES